MPATNIVIPLFDTLVVITSLFNLQKPIIKSEITPRNIKCKYPITTGLKPNASLLKDGTVEPNCNSNLIDNAIAAKIKSHFVWLDEILKTSGLFKMIAFNKIIQPSNSAMADKTTST